MIVRRTGAKRGCSPVFFVQADRPEEQAAIKAGLLETDPAAAGLWPPRRYVLAYGFGSKQGAEAAIDRMRPDVEAAVQKLDDADAEESG